MNLEQLKNHPLYPFNNFQSDDLTFLLLELYWAELFSDVFANAQNSNCLLSDWTARSPAEREDGNPIFNVINHSTQPSRALRIIQRFNTEHLVELNLDKLSPVKFIGDAYVAFVPGLTYEATDDDGITPIEELVISSDISESCERLNTFFIKKWCIEHVSIATMQTILDDFWAKIQENLIEKL
jgi:Icc-related predicted phosphoesterase